MDLTKFDFPKITDADIAFSTMATDKSLLQEAKLRGFYDGHTKYNRLFSQLFFSGGKLKFKHGIQEDFRVKCVKYLRSLMGSFSPKHEEKEAICAMLLSEICEPEIG